MKSSILNNLLSINRYSAKFKLQLECNFHLKKLSSYISQTFYVVLVFICHKHIHVRKNFIKAIHGSQAYRYPFLFSFLIDHNHNPFLYVNIIMESGVDYQYNFLS